VHSIHVEIRSRPFSSSIPAASRFGLSSHFSFSLKLDEQQVTKMHEEGRPYETIRIPLQHSAERPRELNHIRGSHVRWRKFSISLESCERAVDDDAGIALRRLEFPSEEFVA